MHLDNHKPLPRPPYSGILYDKLRLGYHPKNDIFCYFGDRAWDVAKTVIPYNDVICFPSHNNPDDYDLSVVKTLPILLIDTTPFGTDFGFIERLVYRLLNAGAFIVRLITHTGDLVAYQNKEVMYDQDSW